MPLNPFKVGLNVQFTSLFDLYKNVLNNVLVFDRFARRCPPPILTPIDIPRGDTINSVPTVGDD